jgi:hypothetical protein
MVIAVSAVSSNIRHNYFSMWSKVSLLRFGFRRNLLRSCQIVMEWTPLLATASLCQSRE